MDHASILFEIGRATTHVEVVDLAMRHASLPAVGTSTRELIGSMAEAHARIRLKDQKVVDAFQRVMAADREPYYAARAPIAEPSDVERDPADLPPSQPRCDA